MPRVRRHVRSPLKATTPRRYPRQSVLDQLDSEGHSALVDQYRRLVKHGEVNYKDSQYDQRQVGIEQTGTADPGEGGAYR